ARCEKHALEFPFFLIGDAVCARRHVHSKCGDGNAAANEPTMRVTKSRGGHNAIFCCLDEDERVAILCKQCTDLARSVCCFSHWHVLSYAGSGPSRASMANPPFTHSPDRVSPVRGSDRIRQPLQCPKA